MPIAWHPKTWWKFYISEDEGKEFIPKYTLENIYYNLAHKGLIKLFSQFFLSNFSRHFISKYIFESIYNNLAHKGVIYNLKAFISFELKMC